MKATQSVYQYDFYLQYQRTTKRWIDEGLEAYSLYPENHSIINQIAYCYYYINDYFNALDFILKAQNLKDDYKSSEESYFTLKLCGDIYSKLGISQSAITSYIEALKNLGSEDLKRKRCNILRHMSNVYIETRTLDLATDYAVEALQLAELVHDNKLIGDANLTLCRIHIIRKLYDKAIKFGIKAIEVYKDLNVSKGLIKSYLEIASIYANQNDPDLSQSYYERALMLSTEIDYDSGIIYSNYLLGKLLYKRGHNERALFVLEEALNVSRRYNIQSHKVDLYYLLAELYADSGDFELAYNAYKTGTQLKEHLSSDFNKERIYKLQNEYNLFIKEKQLKQYMEENVNLEKKNRQLNEEVQLDALTNLYNRRGLRRAINNMKYDGSHIIILSDIDDFKHINDEYGHPCGDELLKEISKIFKEHSKPQYRVARWGGEEFLIVLPSTTFEAALEYTTNLLNKINSHRFKYKDIEFGVTMTFGVAQLIGDFESSIHLADQRLYHGKRSGKNQVVFR